MTEKPILFSGSMVQAILDGRKSMTRRVVTELDCWHNGLNRNHIEVSLAHAYLQTDKANLRVPYRNKADSDVPWEDCGVWKVYPRWEVGNRLWAKESSWIWCRKAPNGTTKTGRPKFRYVPVGKHVVYALDGKPSIPVDNEPDHLWKYKSARFMPRWASRITLEVTSVRVEKLQDISEEDAKAEGVHFCVLCGGTGAIEVDGVDRGCPDCKQRPYIWPFERLWDSINASRGFPWEKNPWVWRIEFKRIMEGTE